MHLSCPICHWFRASAQYKATTKMASFHIRTCTPRIETCSVGVVISKCIYAAFGHFHVIGLQQLDRASGMPMEGVYFRLT